MCVGVKTGRVTKATPKKGTGSPIKKEVLEDDVPDNSFATGSDLADELDDEI